MTNARLEKTIYFYRLYSLLIYAGVCVRGGGGKYCDVFVEPLEFILWFLIAQCVPVTRQSLKFITIQYFYKFSNLSFRKNQLWIVFSYGNSSLSTIERLTG